MVKIVFKNLCILVLWTKVASALEGSFVMYQVIPVRYWFVLVGDFCGFGCPNDTKMQGLSQDFKNACQILIPATSKSLLCQKGHFTLQLCPRKWFVRIIFGNYTPKVKIEKSS